MKKQITEQAHALEETKSHAQPKMPLRMALICFLLLYAIVVLLLCGYAARLRRPSVSIVSDSSGELIPPPALTGDIDLNTADQDTLRQLPGIGEKLSQAILDYREEYGPFDFPEDTMFINGIGEKRLENMRPYITLSESP